MDMHYVDVRVNDVLKKDFQFVIIATNIKKTVIHVCSLVYLNCTH